MCDAIAVGMGVALVGSFVKAKAQEDQGQAAKAANFRDADFSDRAAADAIRRGELKDLQVAMRGSSVVSRQRVIQSGTGFDVNVGSPKTTQDATQSVSDLDRQIVRRNASLEAYGLQARARSQRQSGLYGEAEGDNAASGTFLSGFSSAIMMGGKGAADTRSPYDMKVDALLASAPSAPDGEA